jgi:hypothetical protein
MSLEEDRQRSSRTREVELRDSSLQEYELELNGVESSDLVVAE